MSSSSSSSPCNSPSPISVPPSIAVANNVGSPTPQVADPTVVMSPCAACKILRRRCSTDKCVLAPYFPPTDPLKFTIAHKVFGASNIIKLLQDLPEDQRTDAVSSMVYEANARLRDPVYGCAGAIWQLQKQVSDMQAELAKAQAEIVNMKCQQANLLALICMEMSKDANNKTPSPTQDSYESNNNHDSFLNIYEENNNLNSIWEPLWT